MRDVLLEKVQEKANLPPLPDILGRLVSKIEDPDGNISEVAELIETEPVLAGKLLALSNSVFFGAGRDKVETMQGAVLRLGLKLVLDLAYTLELPGLFSGIRQFDQQKFWKHSLAVGILANLLSHRWGASKQLAEQGYLAGLMHDIGILLFCFLVPEKYEAFLSDRGDSDVVLEDEERDCFGIGHAELGSCYIEKWWPVDTQVAEAIRRHHDSPVGSSEAPLVASVCMANILANQFDWANGFPGSKEPLDRKFLVGRGMNQESYQDLIEEARVSLDSAQNILMH